jgi:hypothetical protein
VEFLWFAEATHDDLPVRQRLREPATELRCASAS